MANIFFIVTPLQYINAIELISYLKIEKDNNVLVLLSIFDKSNAEIDLMLDKSKWDRIIKISNNSGRIDNYRYFKYILISKAKILKILSDYKEVFNLIIGNYNDTLSQFIIQRFNYTSLFVIDDGLVSIETAHHRNNEIKLGKSIVFSKVKVKWRPRIVRLILNLKNKPPEKINFFTAYNVEKNFIDEYFKNKYSILKTRIQLTPKNNKLIYFMGQPLVNLNIVNLPTYLGLLKEIVNRNTDKQMFYIPHRTEKEESLQAISLIMPIRVFNLPIEFAVLSNGVIPGFFMSFYSSAIVNLSLIYGNQAKYKFYKILYGDKACSKLNRLNNILDTLTKTIDNEDVLLEIEEILLK